MSSDAALSHSPVSNCPQRSEMRQAASTYVDPVAVERFAAGDRVRVTPKERRAAVQRLTRGGLSTVAIAERIGVSPRTVTRCRHREPVEVSAFG